VLGDDFYNWQRGMNENLFYIQTERTNYMEIQSPCSLTINKIMAKKILIIDDDKIFAKILKDGLTQGASKHEVSVAHDGEEGLEKVKQDRPDLIVLDMMMPRMSGIDFLKKLKLFNVTPAIPVVISSQLMDVEKISESVELGVKGYIVKSDFSLENIIKQIESILNKEH